MHECARGAGPPDHRSAALKLVARHTHATPCVESIDVQESPRSDDCVQVVGGKPYSFNLPPLTPVYFVIASVLVAAFTSDWVHFAGTLAVMLIGLLGANPRLSPVGAGCLPFLFMLTVAGVAIWQPRIGIPIASWGMAAWIVASVELRLKMKPYRLNDVNASEPVEGP